MTREGRTPRARGWRLSDIQCATCFRITRSRTDSTRLPQSFFPWTQKLRPWTTKAPLNYYARRKQKTDGPIDEAAVFHPIADQSGNIAEHTPGKTESNSRPDVSPIELVTDNAKTSPTARPSQKNVSKLVSLFETGGKLPQDTLPGSMEDNGDGNQNQSHPQIPLTTNAISAPTDGKRLVPERDTSAPGSASPSTDLGDVVLRLKDIENKYERRQPYKSIFINAPLYQDYSQRVARKESRREARRRHGARQALAKVSPGENPTGSNSLEFDDSLFEAIDSDELDFGDLTFPGRSPYPDVPKHGKPDKTHEWDAEELAGAASDLWKRTASLRASSRSTDSESRKSPPVVDNRTRILHPEGTKSPERSGSLNHPSSPTRPYYNTCSAMETKTFANEIAGIGPNRAMWCNMPQVISAGLSVGLSSLEKKLQEALFEIITSEASYYRSLNVLIEVFYKAPCMQPGTIGAVVTHTQKHHLFSNVLEISLTSETFLSAMEACFREDPMLKNLCEIVYEHAESQFDTYIPYVQNQMYQTRTLCKLLETPAFAEAVKTLQRLPEVGCLDMNSFLLLPLQRVTRLRLLVATVLNYAPKNTVVYQTGLVALAALEKVLSTCEAKKSYMEQKERLVDLCMRLDYKMDAKSVAIDSRRLIKEGELRLITVQRLAGSAFHRKFSGILRQKVVSATLFLFNDLLLITKKRSNQRFMVDEHCPLSRIRIEVDPGPADSSITKYYPAGTLGLGKIPGSAPVRESEISVGRRTMGYVTRESKDTNQINGHGEDMHSRASGTGTEPLHRTMSIPTNTNEMGVFPFRLIIESPNSQGSVYNLQAKSLSERERWIDALSPKRYGIAEDLVYKVWDCPQVLATRSHSTNEGDELELKEGDQASILVSLNDVRDQGWYKGMISDGRVGWFPSANCVEVQDALMKRENMRNFMLLEEARAAYRVRKAREQFSEFPRLKDVARSKKLSTEHPDA